MGSRQGKIRRASEIRSAARFEGFHPVALRGWAFSNRWPLKTDYSFSWSTCPRRAESWIGKLGDPLLSCQPSSQFSPPLSNSPKFSVGRQRFTYFVKRRVEYRTGYIEERRLVEQRILIV